MMVKIQPLRNDTNVVTAVDESGREMEVLSIKIVRENGTVVHYDPDTKLYRLALHPGTKHRYEEGDGGIHILNNKPGND